MMRADTPIYMLFPRLPSTNAVPPSHGSSETFLTANYSSVFRKHTEGNNSISFDGEILRTELHSRIGLFDRGEIFVTIPTMYGTSGLLDSFVENYHDTINVGQDGRDLYPKNQFGFEQVYRGNLAYSLKEDQFGLGDISVGGGWLLLEETHGLPATQLRGAVELPTGDVDDGFGSGDIDTVLGLVMEKRFESWFLHALSDYTIVGGMRRLEKADVDPRNTWTAQLALEKQLWTRYSALAQLRYESSPISTSDPKEADDDGFLYALGLFADLSEHLRLQLAFTEDIIGKSIQDFTATAGLVFRF